MLSLTESEGAGWSRPGPSEGGHGNTAIKSLRFLFVKRISRAKATPAGKVVGLPPRSTPCSVLGHQRRYVRGAGFFGGFPPPSPARPALPDFHPHRGCAQVDALVAIRLSQLSARTRSPGYCVQPLGVCPYTFTRSTSRLPPSPYSQAVRRFPSARTRGMPISWLLPSLRRSRTALALSAMDPQSSRRQLR